LKNRLVKGSPESPDFGKIAALGVALMIVLLPRYVGLKIGLLNQAAGHSGFDVELGPEKAEMSRIKFQKR